MALRDLTFGDMKTQITDLLGARTTDERVSRMIGAQLNAAHDTICALEDWDWLEDKEDVDIDSTTTTIDVPDDWRSVVGVELQSIGTLLPYREPQIRTAKHLAVTYRARSTPRAWTSWGNDVYLDPYPAGDDTLTLYGILATTAMSGDSDEPLVPAGYRQLLVYEALANIASQDTFDIRVQARARDNAKRLLASLRMTSGIAHSRILSVQHIMGQL